MGAFSLIVVINLLNSFVVETTVMTEPNKGGKTGSSPGGSSSEQGPDPNVFGPVSRFFIKYIRPDRDLQIGTSKPDKDNLRQVEVEHYIQRKARQRAHYICAPYIIDFDKCGERESAWINWYKCRPFMKEMTKCLDLYTRDEKIFEESKQEYLKERSYYRETGKCFSEDPKTERKLKFWIDSGRKDYTDAKTKCEENGKKFDWVRDHCKFTKGLDIDYSNK